MKYFLSATLHFLLIYGVWTSVRWTFPSIVLSCSVCSVVLCLIASIITYGLAKKRFLNDVVDPRRKAIFITGCDTGFGNGLARRMDSRGYHVFAGCLFPEGPDATRLKESCSQRLKIVGLDVTKDESVEKAVEFVKSNLNSCEFWAVVNNAGILKGYSVEATDLKDFQDTMEVNAFGPIRVTKAFLPLLKKTKGRVVTVTSLAGRVSIPYSTPYFMSKFAATGLIDSMRLELHEYGIRVIAIEPELYQTNITAKKPMQEKTSDVSASTSQKDEKEEHILTAKKQFNAFVSFGCTRTELVVDDLENAITSQYPETIYKPTRNIFFRLMIEIFKILPISCRDFLIKLYLRLVNMFY